MEEEFVELSQQIPEKGTALFQCIKNTVTKFRWHLKQLQQREQQ